MQQPLVSRHTAELTSAAARRRACLPRPSRAAGEYGRRRLLATLYCSAAAAWQPGVPSALPLARISQGLLASRLHLHIVHAVEWDAVLCGVTKLGVATTCRCRKCCAAVTRQRREPALPATCQHPAGRTGRLANRKRRG